MGRYDDALAEFNRAIELDPNLTWAIVYRGITCRDMRRYEEALTDFTAALELGVDQGWVLANRGVAYRLMKRYEEALADFDRAIKLRPDMVWPIASRGETYRLMERYEEALADFDRAIELEPGNGWYLYDRALTHRAMGRVDQAQADLSAAIRRVREQYEQDPQDWRNALNLALYHLAAGEADEAERLYEEALAGGAPPHRIRDALRDLDDFLALFPDHPQAQAMRDMLQEYLQETER